MSGAAVMIVAVTAILPGAFEDGLKRRFVCPSDLYPLSEAPRFLTEELAIAKGAEALARNGFGTNAWTLVPDRRSIAPNGRADEYLVRNARNPNRGMLTFRNGVGSQRLVQLELEGVQLRATVVIPK